MFEEAKNGTETPYARTGSTLGVYHNPITGSTLDVYHELGWYYVYGVEVVLMNKVLPASKITGVEQPLVPEQKPAVFKLVVLTP